MEYVIKFQDNYQIFAKFSDTERLLVDGRDIYPLTATIFWPGDADFHQNVVNHLAQDKRTEIIASHFATKLSAKDVMYIIGLGDNYRIDVEFVGKNILLIQGDSYFGNPFSEEVSISFSLAEASKKITGRIKNPDVFTFHKTIIEHLFANIRREVMATRVLMSSGSEKEKSLGEHSRKSFAFLIQNNDIILKAFTEEILANYDKTPTFELEANISVFSEIDPQLASQEVLDNIQRIALETEYICANSAVKCLVHFANSSYTRKQASTYILKLLETDEYYCPRILKGLWKLENPDRKIQQKVIELAKSKPAQDDYSSEAMTTQSLVEAAVEVLDKWGVVA